MQETSWFKQTSMEYQNRKEERAKVLWWIHEAGKHSVIGTAILGPVLASHTLTSTLFALMLTTMVNALSNTPVFSSTQKAQPQYAMYPLCILVSAKWDNYQLTILSALGERVARENNSKRSGLKRFIQRVCCCAPE